MKKEGIITVLLLQLLTMVSAYGETGGIFIGGFHLDVNLLILGAVFLASFWAIIFILRLINLNLNETPKIILSLVLAAFSAYGAFKLQIDFQTIFFDLGINKLTTAVGPWIFVITAILIVFIWNLSTFFFVYGAGFTLLGIIGGLINEVEKWGVSIIIGIILILIGLFVKKRMGIKTIGAAGKGIKNIGQRLGHILNNKKKVLDSIKKLKKMIKNLEKKYMKVYNSNDPDKFKKAEEIKKQIDYLKQRLQELINQEEQLEEQEGQEIQRQNRERLNIQTQYDQYSNRIQQIMAKYNRKIPKGDSKDPEERNDSAEYSRLSRAMRKLRKIAKEHRINLK